jgi:predicted PhzF superfamily epimerase YddE/YHI9
MDGPGLRFRARMFAPGLGIAEDPATGSAVASFAGRAHAVRGARETASTT